MSEAQSEYNEMPPALKVVPTVYPTSPPICEQLDGFWEPGPDFDNVRLHVEPPATPLAILESLGPSPFEPGGFRLIGFLATTYDKVSRYALERSAAARPSEPSRADGSANPIGPIDEGA